VRHPVLDDDERRARRNEDRGRADHQRREAGVPTLDQREGQRRQRKYSGELSCRIQAPGASLGGGYPPRCQDHGGQPDRNVDEEHPPPAGSGDQYPTQDRAGRCGDAGDPAPHADRSGPACRIGKGSA
jgi:hypothetical protein